MKLKVIFKKKKVKIPLIVLGSLIFVIGVLSLLAGPRPEKFEYGVTFSPYHAQSLGLEWKQVYADMLDDLGVKKIRIGAFWNQTEPHKGEYNFSDLDFQVNEASKRNAKLVLAVGRRLPRWPECHDPAWLKGLGEPETEAALLSYIEVVVSRYVNNPAVEIWQVENEPFLSSFGECPLPKPELLDREIALVKRLDPVRPVLISDTGELSPWFKSGKRGDMFGSTLYRYVFSDVFNRYWINYNPYWLYRAKAGLVRLLNNNKPVVIIELQAEAWTTKGILDTPLEEQFRTMSLEKFQKMISLGRAIGFNPQYLWGVEWWAWMKTQGHPEFWDAAKVLMNKN